MDNRASPWFKKFVPELFAFMTQEHVAQLGITGQEFARLLEVRTVEELDGFLGARSDAARTEQALGLSLDLDKIGRPLGDEDSDDETDPLRGSFAASSSVWEKSFEGPKHKWVWDCSLTGPRGRPVGGKQGILT